VSVPAVVSTAVTFDCQLDAAVSVERYDVGDLNVRAIKAPLYLDF